jgi:hypothetical protein
LAEGEPIGAFLFFTNCFDGLYRLGVDKASHLG